MTDYSIVKYYLDKNDLHYFTFSPNSEKPIKIVSLHLPPLTPEEDISNSLPDLVFSTINMRQRMSTRKAPNGQSHLGTLPLFLTKVKTLAISGPIVSNCLGVCGTVVATCVENNLKRQI
jgi:hypothetical protein